MYFIIYAKDKPNHTELRADTRPEHVAWLKANAFHVAGPLLADDNETMIGSLLILEADNKADAAALIKNDPYAKVGLFASVELHAYSWPIGAPSA